MILKVEKAQKSGYEATTYVMGSKDAQGRLRAGVDVLRGDPERFRMLTASLPFEQTYASLEISFDITDKPTNEEVDAVVRDVVAMTTLGHAWIRTDHLAVKHTSTSGRVDVHILVPKVDLVTGKSYNPTPPGFTDALMRLQTAWNAKKGWADPLAAKRRRLFKLPRSPSPHRTRALARYLWEREWIETTSKEVMARVMDGRIRTHLDVVRYLKLQGELDSRRTDQLAVHVLYQAEDWQKPTTRKIILQGMLYRADVDLDVVRKRIKGLDAPKATDKPRPELARRYRQAHESWLAGRTDYLEQQFMPSSALRVRVPDRMCLPIGPAKHLCTREDRQAFDEMLHQEMQNQLRRSQVVAKRSAEDLPDRDQASLDVSEPIVMDAEAMKSTAVVAREATIALTNLVATEGNASIEDTDGFDHPGRG